MGLKNIKTRPGYGLMSMAKIKSTACYFEVISPLTPAAVVIPLCAMKSITADLPTIMRNPF